MDKGQSPPSSEINNVNLEIIRAATPGTNVFFVIGPPLTPQVSTFIMMYRTHCQRILDTVIRANFDEVGQQH